MKKNIKTRSECITKAKKYKASSDDIQKVFVKLGLASINKMPYSGSVAFSRQFKRCSLYEDVPITDTAHAGV